jgi:hypothetical protein
MPSIPITGAIHCINHAQRPAVAGAHARADGTAGGAPFWTGVVNPGPASGTAHGNGARVSSARRSVSIVL